MSSTGVDRKQLQDEIIFQPKGRVVVDKETPKPQICTNTTFFKVLAVFGVAFAAVGALALMGLLLPNSGPFGPYLEVLGKVTSYISTGLGGDPLFTGIFATTAGSVFFLSGILGLALQSCSQRRDHHKTYIRDDGEVPVRVVTRHN